MADYTYNDALSRLVKSLDMKSPVAYISVVHKCKKDRATLKVDKKT